ncbi:MAG: hypothetical protein ACLFWB_05845 [Armatimonadota bacterium]
MIRGARGDQDADTTLTAGQRRAGRGVLPDLVEWFASQGVRVDGNMQNRHDLDAVVFMAAWRWHHGCSHWGA